MAGDWIDARPSDARGVGSWCRLVQVFALLTRYHPLRPLVYRLARRLFIGVHVAAENGRWFLPTAERTQVRQRHRL